MFSGFAASAQFLPSKKAMFVVESTVTDLLNTPPILSGNGEITPSNVGPNLTHSLKIKVGRSMIKPLGNGKAVEDVIRDAIAPFVSNDPFRNSVVAEVETFYRNLLKF